MHTRTVFSATVGLVSLVVTLVAVRASAQSSTVNQTGKQPAPSANASPRTSESGSTTTDASATTTPQASAGAAGAAGADQSAAKSAPQDVDASTYSVRLRDVEQRISQLKDQVFRSKARLSLLAEQVLHGVVSGAQATIFHQNDMSGSYRLVKATYALDGTPIFSKADEEGGLGQTPRFEIYNGSIAPGEHTLTVGLEYVGNGYGIFSYLKGYRFRVTSSHLFSAVEGKSLELSAVGYERGGPTTPIEEKPAVRYVERHFSARDLSAAKQEPASPSGSREGAANAPPATAAPTKGGASPSVESAPKPTGESR
jgi:hypothetical protein